MEPVQILWSPAGANMPQLGSMELLDITDGDTPNLRMPVRMLSVDTPEVTAKTPASAARMDDRLAQLAQWIETRNDLPITGRYADYLSPKIRTGKAGTLQFTQGKDAPAFTKDNATARLTKPNGDVRRLFVRTADSPFDDNHRLLAYLAPNYSAQERRSMDRRARSTFNLDLIREGWAAPLVIYPSSPVSSTCPSCSRPPLTPPRRAWGSGRTPRPSSPTSTAWPRSSSTSPRPSSPGSRPANPTRGDPATA